MRQLLRLRRKRMRVEGWLVFLNDLNIETAGTEDEVAEVFAEALGWRWRRMREAR